MGELAALASAALWAAASLIFASAGARMPAVTMNLLKTGLAFFGLALTSRVIEGHVFASDLAPSALGWLAASGVLGLTIGDSLYFASLQLLGTRRALVLWALTPAATAILGALFLSEPITAGFLFGFILTSAGVGIVLSERAGAAGARAPIASWRWAPVLGVLAGLGAVLCQAAGSVTAKLGGGGLSGLELAVLRLAFGTVALAVPGALGLRAGRANIDLRGLAQVGLATFIGTYLGIWLWMIALQNAFAGVVATLQSTSPVFVLPMARFALGERVGTRAGVGSALAVAGVAVLAWPR